MSTEDELGNAVKVAKDLAEVLREARVNPETGKNPEVEKLHTLLQGWVEILETVPTKEYISDIWYDLKAEVQFYDWGGNTEEDLGPFAEGINELENEFYEIMIAIIDSMKEDKEESKRENMLKKLKRRI